MELEYIPKVCRGKEAEFDGKVILKIPAYADRLNYSAEIGMKVNADGEVDYGDQGMTTILSRAARDVEKHIILLAVKKGDNKHSTYQSMCEDPGFDEVTQELAGLMLSGFKVGEN